MGALLGALVLILFLSVILRPSVLPGPPLSSSVLHSYTLDHIPNISRVLSSVGTTTDGIHDHLPPIDAAILPHHTDIGPSIDRYWAEIAENTQPETIVIVSPAHWDQGAEAIQTTKGQWSTPIGDVKTDDDLIDQLRKKTSVSIEPSSFENEHGIAVHTPYIAHYFPDIPIVPIIAQSRAGSDAALEFTDALFGLKKNTLIVSSIDFSHYLSAEISDRNDEQTRVAITQNDSVRIDQMGPDYLDSSFALEVYLLARPYKGCRSQERWHNHNARLFPGIRPQDGTSYFVYTCATRSPLRLSAVGDIMLARGVGSLLARPDQKKQSALFRTRTMLNSMAADSDLTFGNLESVFSNKGVPLNKAYVFQANPLFVYLLEEWRISHLSVSNNHSEDYGKVAWNESVDVLRTKGLVPVGGYSNEAVVETTVAGGKRIAFLGFQTLTVPFSFEKAKTAIIEAKKSHDLVVVSMHWGEEYQPEPEAETVSLAHGLIDAGADMIFGHHPHVLQPVEMYKGKPIFYSLGNFVFDQVGIEQNKSMIATIDVWEDGTMSYLTTPLQIEGFFPRHAF